MAINPKLLKLYQAGGAVNPYDIPGMGGGQIMGEYGQSGIEGETFGEFGPSEGFGQSLIYPGGLGGGQSTGYQYYEPQDDDEGGDPNWDIQAETWANLILNQNAGNFNMVLGEGWSSSDLENFLNDWMSGGVEEVYWDPSTQQGEVGGDLNEMVNWLTQIGVLTPPPEDPLTGETSIEGEWQGPVEEGSDLPESDWPDFGTEYDEETGIYTDPKTGLQWTEEGGNIEYLTGGDPYQAGEAAGGGYTGWGDLNAEMQDYIRGFLPDELEEEAEGLNWKDADAIRELFQSAGEDALGEGLTLGGIRGISQDMLEEMEYGTYDVVREEGREDIISGLVGSVDQSKLGRTLNPELLLADLKDKFQSESFGLEEGISKKRAGAEGDIANIMGEWSSLFTT
tara:strand:+ start:614 stop:1798 length:1185 start_codon:yes stop_codon:yes gene_type:complete